EWEIEHDEALSEMIAKLQDKSRLEPISELDNLQGTLREYQKRGVSWLQYLENLGLNGCLADDMGLGKSVQVIARLVQEKELHEALKVAEKITSLSALPTLLIAPTSVVGNWQKEIAKFAPHLKTMVHHGSTRLQNLTDFKAACEQNDVIISSFTLVRKDETAQFLQDGSDFSPLRSHKLSRLAEMVEEAVSEGESLLIFSQFTEVGEKIEKHLKHSLHCNTYYLHGRTSRPRREQMITEFQDPNTEPSVFILSLKAGGVGITLTKANHVFHFDRWWNPAVEDQATDRAFRIGQKKNV
ncbi:DEAD/DEAH box helicase, partial [Nostoc commune]|uniref:DEAD/DEAH box helicase n=1 Tax=Nostoc commune TaxID=1178 RepID=UPI0018C5F848